MREPQTPLSALRGLLVRAGYEEALPEPVVSDADGPRGVPVHQRATFRTRRDETVMLPADLASGLLRRAGSRRPHRLFQIGAVARYRPEDPNELAAEHRVAVQLVGASGAAALLEVVDLARELTAGSDARRSVGILRFNAGAVATALFDRHGVPAERRRDCFADLAAPEAATPATTVEAALASLGAPGAEALARLPADQQRAVLLELLAALDVRFIGRRRPEDVVDNLLRRVEAARHRARGREVLAPLRALLGLTAPWVQARPRLAKLLGDSLALAGADAVAESFAALGFGDEALVFAGDYQTATLRASEVAFTLGPVEGWCGRQTLPDGSEVPVAGFEAPLAAVLGESNAAPPRVLVVPIAEAEVVAALALARSLRAADVVAELEVAGRGVRTALQHAVARGIPYLALLGETELAAGRFVLRDLARRSQREVPLDDPAALSTAFVEGA